MTPENSFLRMRGNSPFFPLLSRKFPPNLGQVKFTVVTGELERNERACLSLTRAFLSPKPQEGEGHESRD